MRVFDVLACGGFVLAEYAEDLEDLFRIDEEIVVYRTQEELLQKVQWYQAHPDQREAIARAGRKRVLRDHNMERRVEYMLGTISR